jgi:N-acetyl-anhydromuramyl-L-alanine amidase AmpD
MGRLAPALTTRAVSVVLAPLVQRRSPNHSTRHGTHVDLLVWHETAGAYAGSVSWLCNPASEASAHLVIREDGGEVTQLVRLSEKAWHAAAFNPRSVGVEHANVTAKGYATEQQLEASARIFGWLCLHFGIPPRWSRHGGEAGVCRHLDLGSAGGGHTQCGPNLDGWTHFLELLHHEVERGGYRDEWARL